MKTNLFLILALLLFVLFSCVDKPTSSNNRGSVSGTVINESGKSPLAGVTVSIQNIGTKITDATGEYNFTDIEEGAYTISATKTGYAVEQVTIDIEPNINKTVDFSMHTTQPAQLNISPDALDFGLAETSLQLSISNNGDENLSWQANGNQSWITVLPISGTTTDETDIMNVVADRTNLSIGHRTANILVTSNGGSITIPVSIDVAQLVSSPVIDPLGGMYLTPQEVSITCSTNGSQIRYTIDGSDPTTLSNQYTEPFTVYSTASVKARAYKNGWSPSQIVTSDYVINQTVATPTFNPSGGNYTSEQSVTISCVTSDAEIRYTTNGSDPTASSALYASPINITHSLTLKARAFKTGWSSSPIASSTYSINIPQTVATPYFNPTEGTYTSAQSVTISCATNEVEIRYTTDGSDPTTSSALYANPISVTSSLTLKARAYKTGWNSSLIANATYTITGAVATPTFNPIGGTYYSAQNVTISCATSGANIFYSTDGSTPSLVYTNPVSISSNTTLRALAEKSGWIDSQITSATYTIVTSQEFVYVPGGTFNNGTSNVTVSSLFMCKYELTQAEYQATMGSNPSHWQQTDRPVEQVSWFNAIEYCNLRSINEGLTPCYTYNNGTNYGTNPATWSGGWNTSNGNHTNVSCNWTVNGYRLPSEAEWQFAAMGGNQTHNYTYSGSNDLNAVGWYNENSGNTSHTVATLTANELGLFDMSGNVWEWNWDIYGGYPGGSQNNPHGAVSGSSRVIRGGGWFNGVDYCTVSIRNATDATVSNAEVGFRWVRVSP